MNSCEEHDKEYVKKAHFLDEHHNRCVIDYFYSIGMGYTKGNLYKQIWLCLGEKDLCLSYLGYKKAYKELYVKTRRDRIRFYFM